MIKRRLAREIEIGGVKIGGKQPISVQSMTNTETADWKATLGQIRRLEKAGCELARVALNTEGALKALPELVKRSPLPLIADIQFDWRMAIGALKAGVAGLRLNPGNLRRDWQVKAVVEEAMPRKVPIRVGVNAGSLDQRMLKKYHGPSAEAMVASALKEIGLLEDLGFEWIKVSLKSSDVVETVRAYQLLAKRVAYPFHLGITEAGARLRGAVLSAMGIGILLSQGIGDTIRVSLSAPPEDEVRVGWMILSGLGIRRRGVEVIACPTCARAEFDVMKNAEALERKLAGIRKPLRVAVMGCIVNGPGEARVSDLAAVGTARGAQLYVRGKKVKVIPSRELVPTLVKLAEEFEDQS